MAMAIAEALHINNRSNSGFSRITLGNHSILPEARRSAASPEERGGIDVTNSVSAPPSTVVAGARSSQGPLTYLLVTRTLANKKRCASGNAPSLMMLQRCATTAVGQKMSPQLALSASHVFNSWPSASPEDQPIDPGTQESVTARARRSQSPKLHNSVMFSQLNLCVAPEGCDAGVLAPQSSGHNARRSGGDRRPPSTADNVPSAVGAMQREMPQPRHARLSRTSGSEDSSAGDFYGVWSIDDEKVEDVLSRRPSGSNRDRMFPSFMTYFYARTRGTMREEARKPSVSAQPSETPCKAAAEEGVIGSRRNSVDSSNALPRRSSFFGAGARIGGGVNGNVFRTGTTSFSTAMVRVLHGDFDQRDASLDSRLLDSDHLPKPGLTSKEHKGLRRPRPASSGRTVAPGSAANGHAAGMETVGRSRASSGRPVDGSVRHRPSGNAILSIFGGVSSGNVRGSFSVTRSLSSDQVHGLVPVPSQQTLVRGWRLLSFREQDDTPLSNVEHVPHNGKPKKKRRKGKKVRSHEKRGRPRPAAEKGHEGNGAGSGAPTGRDALKERDPRGSAARMGQERNATRSSAEVGGPTAAGAAPAERPAEGTRGWPSCPGGYAGASPEGGGARSRVEASCQLLGRQQAALHNHILQPQSPRRGVIPTTAGKQMRILPFRTPILTVPVNCGTRSARQSPHSAAKSASAAGSAHVPQLSTAGVQYAERKANGGSTGSPDRFEKFKEPPSASPSATVRRVTVRSGKPKVWVPNGLKGAPRSSGSGDERRLGLAPPTQGRRTVSPPKGRLPTSTHGDISAREGEPPLHFSPPREGLPPL
ncbi:hypothetical protein LSCM1_02814 [Leishmania martiniquensis]|uniref:Uncharacterized protein n=1 Tax=Leishmania martiniquensis TaxID=1580590 RepID=A0A836H413_9TRYP|nr:hypothetical protein LSCM1_02814 [Leishmania martiniquensis]